MIRLIIGAGAVGVLIASLVRTLSDNVRGLVCWTISSLALVISAVVYFSGVDGLSLNRQVLFNCAAAAAALTALILLIELFAPSRRLRSRDKAEYDSRAAEQSLNIVFVITAWVLAAAAAATELFGADTLTGICLVPAAAVSIRQLSYFLYRARTDTADKTEKRLREEALGRLKTGKREL